MVIDLLRRWSAGDSHAFDQLIEKVYDPLLRIARRLLRRVDQEETLEPCALVHETYFEMPRLEGIQWADEAHFYNVVSQVMRRTLIDRRRRRKRKKRGGEAQWVGLEEVGPTLRDKEASSPSALEDALVELRHHDPRKFRIVVLRFFSGLTGREIGRHLSISSATVQREWRRARTWLLQELSHG